MLSAIHELAREAGEMIMPYYQSGLAVEQKADLSPVTEADRVAHTHIMAGLRALTPDIPIISEESESHPEISSSSCFWLVDPLDGTKSFIRGSGSFTVNIGLIENNTPQLGVIYAPVEKTSYLGLLGEGAWKQEAGEPLCAIACRMPPEEGLYAVVSFSHLDPKTEQFLAKHPIAGRTAGSSSIKFCAVAEGIADLYPRFGTTMEWDTAAGHAIVAAAGGRVITPDGNPFLYGKPDFRNDAFIVWGA